MIQSLTNSLIQLVVPSLFSIEATASAPEAQQAADTLIVGQTRGPVDLDCVFAWDSASSATYDQCIEGLFQYDLTAPDLAILPILASADGTWLDDVTYEVPLRDGVLFHDVADAGVGIDHDLIGQAGKALAVHALLAGEMLAERPVLVHQRHADRRVGVEHLLELGDDGLIIG